MNIKWKIIIVIAMVLSVMMIIGVYIHNSFNLSFSGSSNFRNKIYSKYSFVKNIDIYGNSPTLFIKFTTNKIVNLDEAKNVFKTTKEVLFSGSVLDQLREAHYKKYGGTMVDVYIDFDFLKNDGKVDYRFYSISEDFSKWMIEYDGDTKEYIP